MTRDKLLAAHGMIDVLIGLGLAPSSAFEFVGAVLALDEKPADWPVTFDVHMPRDGAKGAVVVRRPR